MKISKKIIIFAVLLASITTFGVYSYIKSIKTVTNTIKYVDVVVAKTNIPAKTKIDSSMVAIKKVDSRKAAGNTLASSGQVVGRHTTQALVEGEQFTAASVVDLQNTQFSYQIPKDKRAVTISVDSREGVAFLIKPGDYVDVLLYRPKEEVLDKKDKITYYDIAKIILQKAQVINIDQIDNPVEKDKDSKDTAVATGERKVTLAISPEETEKLALADKIGTVSLALRHPEDDKTYETNGAIREDMIPERGKRIVPNK